MGSPTSLRREEERGDEEREKERREDDKTDDGDGKMTVKIRRNYHPYFILT